MILPTVLYFALQEGSSRRATLGKRKMGLKVVGSRGEKLGAGRALLRSGLKFLPWQLAHTAVFQMLAGNDTAVFLALSIFAQAVVVVFLLSLVIDKRHRTPYDWLAGSRVVLAGGPPNQSPG